MAVSFFVRLSLLPDKLNRGREKSPDLVCCSLITSLGRIAGTNNERAGEIAFQRVDGIPALEISAAGASVPKVIDVAQDDARRGSHAVWTGQA